MHDHPVLHFARDGANFSLNSDDPTVIGTRLDHEYETVRSWGLTEAHLVRAVRGVLIFIESLFIVSVNHNPFCRT